MQGCLETFRIGSAFFVNGIATLEADAARTQIAGDVNPPLWLAGHLLDSRKYLLELFGVERELPFGTTFREKYDPSADYPGMDEIKEKWGAISDELFEKMAAASDDHFDTPIDWNIPVSDKTVRGAVLFYTYHEAYHMGQISYARRGMGMDGLVPY
jgi:hypothetical protein